MIRKNQEMRKNVSKRNSFSQRGARASASFGKGEASESTFTFALHLMVLDRGRRDGRDLDFGRQGGRRKEGRRNQS